mgnify:CR=1 FL=1
MRSTRSSAGRPVKTKTVELGKVVRISVRHNRPMPGKQFHTTHVEFTADVRGLNEEAQDATARHLFDLVDHYLETGNEYLAFLGTQEAKKESPWSPAHLARLARLGVDPFQKRY